MLRRTGTAPGRVPGNRTGRQRSRRGPAFHRRQCLRGHPGTLGALVLRERDEAEVDEKTTLAEAIAYALPKMADATADWDRGSYLLGQWFANHGAWSTLAALPETAHAMVAKDSDGERGKRLCESGTVTTIKALKGSNPKMFWGILAPSETRAVVFLATGDTGRIVDGSAGRVCGVVTGIYRLTLKSGAPFPTPKVVGMFDLPGNRKR